MTDDLIYETRGAAGWITLNRPQARNALTFAMYDRLAEICGNVAVDGPVKALVVTGAGEKAFAAGTDMTEFRGFSGPQDALDYEHRMDVVFGAIEACPVPTIAAISGACTGGGAGIAAACDIRIATAEVKFGFPIARTLGNCLSIANLSRLERLMGAGRGDGVDTDGAAGRSRGGARLRPGVRDRHRSRGADGGGRRNSQTRWPPMRRSPCAPPRRRCAGCAWTAPGPTTANLIVAAYTSQDFREGMEAFLAKRKPDWKGR